MNVLNEKMDAPLKRDTVYLIGDAHFGHRNIGNFRKGVATPADNEALISEWWLEHVHPKRADVWMLGDMAFDANALCTLRTLPGRARHWVLGNHDTQPHHMLYDVGHFPVHGITKRWGAWLSHAPIHPAELRGYVNVHGHVHDKTVNDPRYFNACVDNLMRVFGQPMITLAQLRAWMNSRR